MALPLAEWIESPEVKKFQAMPQEKASHEFFFRNPARTMTTDSNLLFSPADGVITTQGRFDPEADLIDVKGLECSVNTLLGPFAIETPALVIAVFMTAADVHFNRVPTACMMRRHLMPSIRTMNLPMLWAERGLLDAGLIRKGTFGFMAANARVASHCYAGRLRYSYYIVQIADSDVNSIVPMKSEPLAAFNQCEQFGQILWGSMCVLILPLDARFRFKPLCKVADHVEAANDALVRVDAH